MHLWKFEDVIKHFEVLEVLEVGYALYGSHNLYSTTHFDLATFGESTKLGSWLLLETRVNYRHFKRMLELNLHGSDTSKLLLKKNSRNLDMFGIKSK